MSGFSDAIAQRNQQGGERDPRISEADPGTYPAFLRGGGELGTRIRAFPWAATPLGAPETWPQSLRSALSICLHSSFPTAIYWGPELRLLYNDAWAPIPAERHPGALGRPGCEVWADIWDVVGPQFARVMQTGEGFSTYDQMLPMVRGGVRQETYWNYSFTAIRGEDGSVVGVFNQGNETTATVLGRRHAQAEIDRLGRLFAQAPSAVAVLSGPDHVFEIANPAYEELVGRSNLVGRPVSQALPEVVAQGFVDLLDRVRATGEPHVGRAVPVELKRNAGQPAEQRLVDFVYQPIAGAGQRPSIFVQVTDVTDAARADAALRASEEKFQAIANSIDQMIWSTRADGHHDYYNDRWYEFTGVNPGQTDGEAWNGMFHPDDRERAWQVWRNSLATGVPYEIEYRLRHRSGQYRWVIGRAQCVRDASGRITRWYGTCTDVHDLKCAEEELAEQARVLEILNRTGSAIVSEIDLERVVQMVTDAGLELTGAQVGAFFYNVQNEDGESYKLYTVAGVPRDHFAHLAMPRNTHLFDPTFRGHGVVRCDDVTKDPRYGQNKPHGGIPKGHAPVRSYLAVPVTSRSGQVVGGLFFGHGDVGVFNERSERVMTGMATKAAIAIDNAQLFRAAQHEIAERERKEEALRESEEFSRSLVESSGDCIQVLDWDGTLRFVNETGCRLMDVPDPASLCGRPWESLWPAESRAEIEAALAAAREGGFGRFSAASSTAAGKPRWWDVVVTSMRDPGGKPARFVSIARDVTEQREAEQARQLLLRELDHRVKNLFAIASGMVTVTARSAPSVKEMAHSLHGRLNALAKAHDLIRPGLETELDGQGSSSLRDLVEEVLRPHLNADCEFILTGPEVDLGVKATTNLALILHELATNAAKYGALARAEGRLEVTWAVPNGHLELDWHEQVQGHPIAAPSARGFGSKLAQSSVTGPLGGSIDYDWQPSGVRIALKAPCANLRR